MRITVRPACPSLVFPVSVLFGRPLRCEPTPSASPTVIGLSLGTWVNVDYDAVSAAGKDTTDTAPIFKLGYTR